jgi:hypothetical protein
MRTVTVRAQEATPLAVTTMTFGTMIEESFGT